MPVTLLGSMSATGGRFRLTLGLCAWPATPLPLPELWRFDRYELADVGGRTWIAPATASGRSLELPGDAYLRLINVDLEKPRSVLRFVNKYGPLGVARCYDQSFEWVAGLAPGGKGARGFHGISTFRELQASREGQVPFPIKANGETVEEFSFGVRCLRTLVRCRQFMRGETRPDQLAFEVPVADHWEVTERADMVLAQGVSQALATFSPQLDLNPASLPGGEPEVTASQTMLATRVGLYPVLCLELFNHIVENADYRECANQNCRGLFTRQVGRATYGQHRRDSIYCSRECGNAASQRASRGRRAAAIS
jgi:hypothetical protein